MRPRLIHAPKSVTTLESLDVTDEEIYNHLSKLKVTKASGADVLSNYLLRAVAQGITSGVHQLFRKSQAVWFLWSMAKVFFLS